MSNINQKSLKYHKAFKEVYILINDFSSELYIKIPKSFIKILKENMDKIKEKGFIGSLKSIIKPKYKTIKVLSDAGTWIVNGIQNLKLYPENEIIHCLCEFHVKQKIDRITKNKNQARLLVQYILNDNKKDFISLIGIIMKDKDDKRRKTIEGYKNYLIKYWNAFKNMLNSKIRSSMESHISHNVAKYFSFEPKAYSKRRIQKLIKLQEYKANGINILGLYLKSYNTIENITLKKE
mgnify:CR=1 FL=1